MQLSRNSALRTLKRRFAGLSDNQLLLFWAVLVAFPFSVLGFLYRPFGIWAIVVFPAAWAILSHLHHKAQKGKWAWDAEKR